MKNTSIIILATLAIFCVCCSKKKEELKSPCVAEGANNPCDNRVNPNFGWMQRV